MSKQMNQIDPGPGYRIFYRDEPLQDGIQYWSEHKQCWLPRPEPSWVLSPTDIYRIAVDPSQRYRIKGTGSKLDGQIVEVVEWGERLCLVSFSNGQAWIERGCLEAITDHIVDANKKLEPVVKQSLTTEYIEPTSEHIGQMVEVMDSLEPSGWKQRMLVALLPSKYHRRFVVEHPTLHADCTVWQQARIPKPKPEPKYRDVTIYDIGKTIEVRQSDRYGWIEKTLTKIVHTTTYKNPGTTKETMWYCQHNSAWRQARIVDGGEA